MCDIIKKRVEKRGEIIQESGLVLDFETLKSALEKSKIFVITFNEQGDIVAHSENIPNFLKGRKNIFQSIPNFLEIIKLVNKAGFSQDIVTIYEPRVERVRLITLKSKDYYWILGEIITEQLLIDELISERLETLTMYLEFAPVFFVVLNEKGEITYINNWALEKTGYSLPEVLGKNWFDIFIPEEIRPTVKRVFEDIMNKNIEVRKTFENDILTKDGRLITILWENKLLVKDGKPSGAISVGVDVTEQKAKDFEEQAMLSILTVTAESNYHVGISKLANVLEEMCNIKRAVGIIQTHEETKPIEILNKIEIDDLNKFTTLHFKRNLDDRILKLEIAYETLPRYASNRFFENIATIVLSFIDRVYYIQKLEEASFRDPLTNLFNRRYFLMILQAEIRRVKRYGGDTCVVMIDLDGLKQINDTFGHDKGDFAIITLAQVMRENTRSSDIPARFGGDEFALLLPNTALNNAEIIIQRIIKTLDALNVKGFRISISAGITKILPTDDDEGISVLKRADELLYQAKKRGKHTICVDTFDERDASVSD
ncbi:diguanylate cyclase [Fervidobacterium islandicum]|uniref:Diguanylate cyclase n=1 Tax=Fervidobacterium islandicum TaxID=2423 RepID=A0AAI8CNI1_FERIS|nr:diguanylate cyclase [Fervidobacterium islandicum]AMW33731.2 diguanylate cyclase [Fervidobacterium islandicum]